LIPEEARIASGAFGNYPFYERLITDKTCHRCPCDDIRETVKDLMAAAERHCATKGIAGVTSGDYPAVSLEMAGCKYPVFSLFPNKPSRRTPMVK
jgi:hypothetical protein